MTEAEITEAEMAMPTLTCVIPAGWSQVDFGQVFGLFTDLAAAEGIDAEGLRLLDAVAADGGIVVMAARSRCGDRYADLLYISLPEASRVTEPTEADARTGKPLELIEVRGCGAVERVEDTAVDAELGAFQTTVQIAVHLAPTNQLAVVTCLSTEADARRILEHPARSVAASLEIVSPNGQG